MPMRVMILVGGQAELPQVVGAFARLAASRACLHRRQQEADQDGDDRDDDQQLDERKAAPLGAS